ncbi:MAG: hypothetical protein JST55_16125 [Bacteroidetes bacterium]|nr:hypothetical protein [Bacteroidota bacterium]
MKILKISEKTIDIFNCINLENIIGFYKDTRSNYQIYTIIFITDKWRFKLHFKDSDYSEKCFKEILNFIKNKEISILEVECERFENS